MLKIGLVLAGGGGKGAYEIGVWKALKELGIDKHITAVSGTSIGALNAVLFAQGDYEVAENIWLNLTREKILPIDNKELVKKGMMLFIGSKSLNLIKKVSPKSLEQGGLSREGLLEIMEEHIDFKKLLTGNRTCYAACSEIPELNARYFKLNDYDEEVAKKILCASSALPLLYESEEIQCRKYIDGGMADNVPIQPLYGEGCNIIFVVHLSRDCYIDKSKFPGARIVEIIPSEEPGGIISGVLDFSKDAIQKRIFEGYEDAKSLIEPIMDIAKLQFQRMPFEVMESIGKNIASKSSEVREYLMKNYKKKHNTKKDEIEDSVKESV